jgi:hypothetical protein
VYTEIHTQVGCTLYSNKKASKRKVGETGGEKDEETLLEDG